jgi:hypothetical protein
MEMVRRRYIPGEMNLTGAIENPGIKMLTMGS